MNKFAYASPAAPRGQKAVFAVAALAVNTALFSGVAGLFDQASSMPWLVDTQANELRMAECQGVMGTAAHQACVARVVAEVTGRPVPGEPPVRVAMRWSSAPNADGGASSR